LTCNNIEAWPLDSIEVSDNKRKSKHKYNLIIVCISNNLNTRLFFRFSLAQPIDSMTTIADLYPEGCKFIK